MLGNALCTTQARLAANLQSALRSYSLNLATFPGMREADLAQYRIDHSDSAVLIASKALRRHELEHDCGREDRRERATP